MYAQAAIKPNTLLRNGAYGIVMRGVQKCTRGCSSLRDIKRLPLCCIKLDTATDACCGTGGFLIDIFAEMLNKVDAKTNLSRTEKDAIKENIRKKYIVGIDIGKGPNLSRVARLNMYLHGDGGTKIFNTDALDKQPQILDTDEAEIIKEKEELQQIFANRQEYFDVAITNPPFAKVYERSLDSEKRILDRKQLLLF